MEDKEISKIFTEYQPELADDFIFMTKLVRKIEATDIVKNQNVMLMKRNKIALIISSLFSFLSGILFSILQPLLQQYLQTIFRHFQFFSTYIKYDNLMGLTSWIIISIVIITLALCTYNLTGVWVKNHNKNISF